jgi:hypothetical protein
MAPAISQSKEKPMKKAARVILATIAVVVVWFVLDLVIHGVLLAESYRDTAALWRPMEEMKMGLMRIVGLVAAGGFVSIYAYLVNPKNIKTGLLFGLLYGIATGIGMGYGTYSVMPIPYKLAFATGIGMGYGTYSVMPIPYKLAFVWFNATVVEALIAGLITALIVRESPVVV